MARDLQSETGIFGEKEWIPVFTGMTNYFHAIPLANLVEYIDCVGEMGYCLGLDLSRLSVVG